MRRRKWIWRRGSRATRPTTTQPAPLAPLEREAIHLLREWRDAQNDIPIRATPTPQPIATDVFTWQESAPPPMGLSANVHLGRDGVRHRLRGRGEL